MDQKTSGLRPHISFFIEANLLLIVAASLFFRGAAADYCWYPVGLWIVIVFAASLFCWERGWIPAPQLTGLEPILLAWLFFIILSSIFSNHHWMSLLALERLFSALLFFYLMNWHFRDRNREKILLWGLFAIPVAICLVGLPFFITKSKAFFPYVNNLDLYCATFVNHNNLAGLIIADFFLGLGLLMGLKKKSSEFRSELWARWAILAIPLIVLLVSLQLSLSRSGWLALFGAGAGFLCWAALGSGRKNLRYYLAVTMMVLVVGVVVSLLFGKSMIKSRLLTFGDMMKDPGTGLTMTGRKQIWKSTLYMIKEHPVLGIGPGNYWLEYPHYRNPGDFFGEYHAHNDLLQLAAETGIPSALLMIAIFIAGYRIWRRNYKLEMTRFQHRVSIGIAFGMLGFIIQDQVDFHFYIPGLSYYFMALFAFLVRPRGKGHD